MAVSFSATFKEDFRTFGSKRGIERSPHPPAHRTQSQYISIPDASIEDYKLSSGKCNCGIEAQ
jgi:hypothetical protein